MIYLVVLFRALTMLAVFQLVVLMMGRRQVAELPVFDFILAVTIGAVAGADLADHQVPHLPSLFAILVLGAFQFLITRAKVRWRWFGRSMTFEPVVVIQDGTILHDNLRKIRYQVSDLLPLLREKEVFDLSEVKFAIIEPSGNLSLMKKPEKAPPTREETGILSSPRGLFRVVAFQGRAYHPGLRSLSLKPDQLASMLEAQGFNQLEQVFIALSDEVGNLLVTPTHLGNIQRQETDM